MRKIAILLSVLMVMGTVPGWSLLSTVDKAVENHTKSDYRPVEDAGKIYQTVNKGIDKSLDAVPGLKQRNVLLDPIDKVIQGTMDISKKIVNTTWDLITLKSVRSK